MKVKYMIFAFGILPLVFLLTITSYFAAFAITVMTGGVNVLETDTAMVNQGIFNIIRYTLIIVICGWVYYRSFMQDSYSSSDTKKIIKHVISPVNLLMIITIGACIQFATDAVLYILGTLLPESFTSYSAMINEYKGNPSILFIATTVLLAPFAEELIFRGLILKFARKSLEVETNTNEKAKETKKDTKKESTQNAKKEIKKDTPKEIKEEAKQEGKNKSKEKSIKFDTNKKAQMIAIIIQAVLFALYHGNLIQICYALIFGILFGIIAVKFNSLVPSTLIHMVVNGTLYLIPDSFFENIPYACAVFAVAFILLIFTYVMFLKSHKHLSSVESHLD